MFLVKHSTEKKNILFVYWKIIFITSQKHIIFSMEHLLFLKKLLFMTYFLHFQSLTRVFCRVGDNLDVLNNETFY